MKLVLLLTFILIGCGITEEDYSTKNIFGDDSRKPVSTSNLPGAALGRLDKGCTGFLVGKNLALTAAHCVVDSETGTIQKDVRRFDLAYANGQALHSSWIVGAWVGTLQPVQERKNDWAILWLADNLGERSGWLGVAPDGVQQEQLPVTARLAGYAADISTGSYPVISGACYIHAQDSQERLLHDCDAAKGTSGGPILAQQAGEFTVMAMMVSEFLDNGVTDSLHKEVYSHEYANIAVNASAFYQTLAELRSSVEQRLPVSTRVSASYLVNTNSSASSATPPAQVIPENRAYNPQPVLPAINLQLEYHIMNNRVQINHQGWAMVNLLSNFQSQIKFYNLDQIYNYSEKCKAQLNHIVATSHAMNMGQMSQSNGAAQISYAMDQLNSDAKVMLDLYDRTRGLQISTRRALDQYMDDYRYSLDVLYQQIKARNRF